MKTITLKKISIDDLFILQSAVVKFRFEKSCLLKTEDFTNEYFNNLLILDIANYLILRFRNKIENQNKEFGTLKLKIHEGIILMQCCNDFEGKEEFEVNVGRKYLDEIHKLLINLF
jgi:hypothetical protein